ncbi:MAG TPA: helix-turn-helix transcriptional regulator [Allosphingosinicella sp.]|nr:helix-turn-helix transcriptional regulator [Allosphingosinicella sp.]
MKATASELSVLRRQIAAARAENTLSDTEIGELVDVHPSQVGRICRGHFKTISHNVVQICKALGMQMESAALDAPDETLSWKKLESSLRSLWDKTPEGADKIVRVLDTIGALRRVNANPRFGVGNGRGGPT